MSKMYDVIVTREDAWWMVSIPEIDGLTQARHSGEIELMARECIALETDTEVDDVVVAVRGA